MTTSSFVARATSGTLRDPDGIALKHPWTADGVIASPVSNGAQVLHLSVALCVLNDAYREAKRLGVALDGVAVQADGGFDEHWCSTGIGYVLVLDSPAPTEVLAHLTSVVDEVAEIPRAIRAGASVRRRSDAHEG